LFGRMRMATVTNDKNCWGHFLNPAKGQVGKGGSDEQAGNDND
jgi:hypothetical protein